MRELGLAGLVAIVFGLGSYYATRDVGSFSLLNLGAGALALLVALIGGARRLRLVRGPHSRRVLLRGLAWKFQRVQASHFANSPFTVGVRRVRLNASAALFTHSAWVG